MEVFQMKKNKLINLILPFIFGSIVELIPLSFIDLINTILNCIH